MSDAIWLRKARRTQRANHCMRWFYLANIVLNVTLSYVGNHPWVSRMAALVLLFALVVNEAMIHKLDEAIREVNMSTPVEPTTPPEDEGPEAGPDENPDE